MVLADVQLALSAQPVPDASSYASSASASYAHCALGMSCHVPSSEQKSSPYVPSDRYTRASHVGTWPADVHSHIALNFVVSDYVPTKAAPAARAGLLGLTCLTLAGLFTLNTKGEGITRTAKRLWKAPEKEKA